MRDSTIIYRSFYEAIKDLPKENQAEVWNAIFEYSLNFKEIKLDGLSKTVFTLIKPNIDSNIKRYKKGIETGKLGASHGSKGGRPKKSTVIKGSETTPLLNNPPETGNPVLEKPDTPLNNKGVETGNVDVDVDVNDDVNVDVDDNENEDVFVAEQATINPPNIIHSEKGDIEEMIRVDEIPDFGNAPEMIVASKKKKQAQTALETKSSLYKDCMAEYNDFCLRVTRVNAIIDGLSGKSLKKILASLKSASNDGTDEDVLNAWKFILINFNKWEKFHQGQIKLNQISSNLPNIIKSISNGNQQTSNSVYATSKYAN